MIEVGIRKAMELTPSQWRANQELGLRACEAVFADGFDPEAYMEWDDPKRFMESHRDPQSEVGRGFNANQNYYAVRVAEARDAGQVVGWAVANLHNVSGGGSPEGPHDDSLWARRKRAEKLLTMRHDYVHLRDVYVDPEYQGGGVGVTMLRKLVHRANPIRPVAAYYYRGIYKPEVLSLHPRLESAGFMETGESDNSIGGKTVKLVRMQANTGYEVLRRTDPRRHMR